MPTLLFIPQIAWPALTQFAPEKFPELQALYANPDLAPAMKSQVHAELQSLINRFHKWAVSDLKQRVEEELLAKGVVERVNQIKTGLMLMRLHELEQVDLTPTERVRLLSQLIKCHTVPTKPIEDAVKALEKPWKYRDWKPGK